MDCKEELFLTARSNSRHVLLAMPRSRHVTDSLSLEVTFWAFGPPDLPHSSGLIERRCNKQKQQSVDE